MNREANTEAVPFSLPSNEYDARVESRMRDYLAELLQRGERVEEQEKEAA